MLTSRSREVLRTVDTVIVDEIHTMAGTKRGAHLALSSERLELLTDKPPQRIGLSATQRPLEEVARYLGGDRSVRIADAGAMKELDLKVIVPVEDLARPDLEVNYQAAGQVAGTGYEGGRSIWPAVYPELLELVRSHRSTLIFVNNRRLAERIAARLNELAGEELLRAHHGSVSREQRQEIEERAEGGPLPGWSAPARWSWASTWARSTWSCRWNRRSRSRGGCSAVGRAGHQVAAPSTGRIFPKFRGDLLECAVLTERMHKGAIERRGAEEPARRAGPADRRDVRGRRPGGGPTSSASCGGRTTSRR